MSERSGGRVGAAVGALTAGGAVAALAVGAIAAPVAAAVAGAALVGGAAALALGRRRTPERPVLEAPPDPAAELDELVARLRGKVNPMVESRVDRVVTILRETLPRLDQLSGGSQHAHLAIRTATSYLPEAVGAYLRLPASYADRRAVSGGRTSLMLLCDQLDLLASEMDKVFVAVCASDVDALVAHGRFLQETFGTGSSLDIAPEIQP